MKDHGTKFSPTNSAFGDADPEEGSVAFQVLFSPTVSGAKNRTFTRGARKDNCPTDAQAEVLIPGPVSVTSIQCIIVQRTLDERAAREVLSEHKVQIPVHIEPRFFSTDLHNVFVSSGISVEIPGISVG